MTRHRLRRRYLFLSVVLGAVFSFGLSALTPWQALRWFALDRSGFLDFRSRSWLATEYHVLVALNGAPSSSDAIHHAHLLDYDIADLPPLATPTDSAAYWGILETGFPFRCCRGWELAPRGNLLAPTYHDFFISNTTGGLIPCGPSDPLSQSQLSQRYIAYTPIWHGFALDTLVWGAAFAALLWMTIPLRVRLRHRRRRKSLMCRGCAYDLRGLPRNFPCPECGRPRPKLHP